jgi:hypothetical protein
VIRGFVKKLIALLLLAALLPTQLPAWGPKGHAIVADLAQSRLTPSARANLQLLLGNDTLASISTWADQVRKERDESFGWHFVDIPKDAAGFSQPRDCFRPQDKHKDAATDHHNCVVDRIEMFQKILADGNASRESRLEALKSATCTSRCMRWKKAVAATISSCRPSALPSVATMTAICIGHGTASCSSTPDCQKKITSAA